MNFVYTILALLFALYVVGCVLAYRAVSSDRGEYSRWETLKLTLCSWLTVLVGLIGRVQ